MNLHGPRYVQVPQADLDRLQHGKVAAESAKEVSDNAAAALRAELADLQNQLNQVRSERDGLQTRNEQLGSELEDARARLLHDVVRAMASRHPAVQANQELGSPITPNSLSPSNHSFTAAMIEVAAGPEQVADTEVNREAEEAHLDYFVGGNDCDFSDNEQVVKKLAGLKSRLVLSQRAFCAVWVQGEYMKKIDNIIQPGVRVAVQKALRKLRARSEFIAATYKLAHRYPNKLPCFVTAWCDFTKHIAQLKQLVGDLVGDDGAAEKIRDQLDDDDECFVWAQSSFAAQVREIRQDANAVLEALEAVSENVAQCPGYQLSDSHQPE
jgi:hypothetical protein